MIINPFVYKKVSGDPPVTEGDYKVRFIDYDGKVIKEQKVVSGQSATPPTPNHKFLTLDKWQGSYENVTEDTDVYAIYKTTNDSTYLFVDVTVAGGKDVSVNISKTTATATTIYLKNNADEVIDTKTVSGTGVKTTTLTASDYGKHYVEICSDGGSYALGGGSSNEVVIGGSTSEQREMLYRCFVGIASIGHNAFHSCSSLASITIPDGVTSIGSYAFYYCYSLASITIPDGVTSIGNSAFRYCYSLASITIPDSVESIGVYAFFYCYSLTSITIPDGVTSIGNMAFYYCYSCKEYIFTRLTPPTLGTGVFTNITSANRIFVPDESLDNYKTATNWAAWEDYIYPISAREN